MAHGVVAFRTWVCILAVYGCRSERV